MIEIASSMVLHTLYVLLMKPITSDEHNKLRQIINIYLN